MRSTLFLLVIVMVSCEDAGIVEPLPQRGNELVQTDATYYAAQQIDPDPYRRYQFKVITRFTNPVTDTLFLDRCYPDSPSPIYSVQQISPSDSVGSAYSGVWACVGHENPIPVAPHANRFDTLLITGPNMFPNGGGVGFGRTSGTMRLVFHVMNCRKETGCTSSLSGASNAFQVERR